MEASGIYMPKLNCKRSSSIYGPLWTSVFVARRCDPRHYTRTIFVEVKIDALSSKIESEEH
jgi:hypothetical protein